ncbi:MAG TPA: response regulator [Caulobacteraceae bacterium]
MAKFDPKAWINLEKAKVLLLDDHAEGGNILAQIVMGFGVRRFMRCGSVAEAQEVVNHTELHLLLVNANLRESPAFEFIDWLRRANLQPNSFTPVILITGHTQRGAVERARDCGSNIVLAKPVSPQSLLERIIWIAREKRPFVNCGSYMGPDRRFHDTGPPAGVQGRRHNDPPEGAADEAVSEPPPEPAEKFEGGEAA